MKEVSKVFLKVASTVVWLAIPGSIGWCIGRCIGTVWDKATGKYLDAVFDKIDTF